VSAAKQKILDICSDLEDDALLVRLEKPSGNKRSYEFFQVPFYSFTPSRDNCAYHEIIHSNTVRFFCDIDHSTAELFTKFLTTAQDIFIQAFNINVTIKYLHNPVSQGYHVFTNIACTLEMCRFLAERINAHMGCADYVDLGPYALFKSLRLPNCPKVALDGAVNANSRYPLPEGQKLNDFLVTNTIGCIFVKSPLHISQQLPIDADLQFGVLQASDEHVDALATYVKHTLKCPDAVLRTDGNRIHISYGSVRPICPYHKRAHDNDNMFGRVHNGKEA
jgi:hypothetical protein